MENLFTEEEIKIGIHMAKNKELTAFTEDDWDTINEETEINYWYEGTNIHATLYKVEPEYGRVLWDKFQRIYTKNIGQSLDTEE